MHKGHKASIVIFLLIEKISEFPLDKVKVSFRYMPSACLLVAHVQVLLVAVILVILNSSLLVSLLPHEVGCLPSHLNLLSTQVPL